jgi:hypothetical protein
MTNSVCIQCDRAEALKCHFHFKEDTDHPRSEWKQCVAEDKTTDGYWEWLYGVIEEETMETWVETGIYKRSEKYD